MIFEPKELYECSPPWISESKRSGRAGLIIGILIILASILGLLAFNGDFDDESAIGVAGFMICFPVGLVILLVGLYFLRDMKDNWILILPYNKRLYEELHRKSREMLENNSYIYDKNKSIKIHDYERNPDTKQPYARSYQIVIKFTPNIVYEYGLVWVPDTKKMCKLIIRINNVQLGNLRFAKFFLSDVQNVLNEIEHHKYERVLELDNEIRR